MVCYLRDLLLTSAHRDPDVTAFLSCWVYEELWHGEAIGFYASEARYRLDGNRRAQRLTRLALSQLWHPVGASVMPPSEVASLVRHLFSGEDGRAVAARIDRRVDQLPGLAGLHLLSTAIGRLGNTHAPSPDVGDEPSRCP